VDKDGKKETSILISNDVMKYGARQAMMDLIMHYGVAVATFGKITYLARESLLRRMRYLHVKLPG